MAAGKGKIYIPKRIYSAFKGIYTNKVTVISAPDGSGRTTFLSEFILRSRADGITCRFIKDCRTVEECFGRICTILIGSSRGIPVSREEYAQLKEEFIKAKPQKDTIVIVDTQPASEMLLGPANVSRLAALDIPARLVVTAAPLNQADRATCEAWGFSIIGEETLRLTPEETREYMDFCGISVSCADKIYKLTGGNIMKLRLAAELYNAGFELPDEGDRLLQQYIYCTASLAEQGAIITAASFPVLPYEYCNDLAASPVLRSFFGENTFDTEEIFRLVNSVSRRIGLISLNRKNRIVSCSPLLFKLIMRDFYNWPNDVQDAFREALAKQYLRMGNTYYACVEFALIGDYEAAAACPSTVNVSFALLLRSRDVILRIIEAAPLNCRSFFPRYLRLVALLMLTDMRDRVKDKFSEAEEFIKTSRSYTRAEKRTLLSYVHTLRTYDDFFRIEKMGTHIKRAYDLYDGHHALQAPFYSWNMYTPSVFALIHRYSMPISAESEQFLRYHKMYTEMIAHGEHICELYSAEALYYTGSIRQASALAEAELAQCTEPRSKPTRIAFLTLCAKTAMFCGEYHTFAAHAKELGCILHEESISETGFLTAICLSELSSYWAEAESTGFFLRRQPDEVIRLNRYQAPFSYYIIAVTDYCRGDCGRILDNAEKYLAAADEVRSETVMIKMLLLFAVAAMETGDMTKAADWLTRAAEKLAGTDIIAPAAEMLIICPRLSELLSQQLPARYSKYFQQAEAMAADCRRGIETIQTYRTAAFRKITRKSMMTKENVLEMVAGFEQERRSLGLSKREFACAVLAAGRFSNLEITSILDCSQDSVKSCLKRVFAKLGIRSRSQLRSIVPAIDR